MTVNNKITCSNYSLPHFTVMNNTDGCFHPKNELQNHFNPQKRL